MKKLIAILDPVERQPVFAFSPTPRSLLLAFALAGLAATSANAFTITPIWDASVTNSGIGPTIQAAFTQAAQFFQSTYTDPINVNIVVDWGSVGPFTGFPVSGGASYANYNTGYAYNTVYTALTNDAKSAADLTSINTGTVALNNPTPLATFMLPTAQAKALNMAYSYASSIWAPYTGFNGATNNVDGWVTFGSNTNNWFFNPANLASNKDDFIGTAEHEISEVLGRVCNLGNTNFYQNSMVYDLFRYSGSGARNFTTNYTGNSVYFSIDNGTNNLSFFNGNGGTNGDLADWAVHNPADAYDWTGPAGVTNVISQADITALDVIGYDINVPEPSPTNLLATALFTIATFRLRRRAGSAARRRRSTGDLTPPVSKPMPGKSHTRPRLH